MPDISSFGKLGAWLAQRHLEQGYRRAFDSLSRVREIAKFDWPNRPNTISMMIGTLGCGGAERQLMLTLGCIKEDGLAAVSLTTASLGNEWERFYLSQAEQLCAKVSCVGDKVANHLIPESMSIAFKKFPTELAGVICYIQALLEDRPHVAHLWMDEINLKGGIAAVVLGVPRIVLSTRNISPNNFAYYQPYMLEGYRWLLRQPGVVMLNNSSAGARSYEKWLSLREGTVRVVRNGFVADPAHMEKCKEQAAAYRARIGIPENVDVMGGVLRLSEEKRPLLWLETAHRVGTLLPDTHFLLVGNGPMQKDVADKAVEMGLSGRLHRIEQEKDIYRVLAAMDLMLLSSRAEGLPNVLLEAQAMGVPVVTTAVGGAPEALEHGVTGWVLENSDPHYIAQVVAALLEDSRWRRRASAMCPKFVFENFSLERMFAETVGVYGLGVASKDAARCGDE